jgi:hypothetical protein
MRREQEGFRGSDAVDAHGVTEMKLGCSGHDDVFSFNGVR